MNKLINEAKKIGIDIEVNENKNNVTSINTLNNTLKLFQISNVTRYGVKAVRNNKCIKLITENIKNTKELLASIIDMLDIQDNSNENAFCNGNISSINDFKDDIDYELIKKDLLSLDNLKKKYKELKAIEVSFEHVESFDKITNKVNNSCMEQSDYINSYGVSITLEKNNETKVLYISYFDKKYNFQEFKMYIIKRLEEALLKLESKSIKTGKYKVLLTNNVTTSLIETFVDAFQSKNIAFKNSVLTDKFKEKKFSEKINIVEDSLNGILKEAFDSEGTKKNYQEIVKDGVFVKKINDLEYAFKTKSEPTGNANGVNNLYLIPGSNDYNTLVNKLNDGIIINEIYGLHSGIDKKTGNISLQAEGFEVVQGKIKNGLNMIILSSNLFEIFSNVLEVGNDLTKENVSVLAPSLLLSDITVTGKE